MTPIIRNPKKTEILLKNSIIRLTYKKEYFKKYNSIDEWIFKDSNQFDKEKRYLLIIKNQIMKKYQLKNIFISPSAVDDIIFYCIKNYSADILLDKIDELIIKSGLNRNSVVIVPLHSFGFKYLGAQHFLGNASSLSYTHENFTIYPQTNSIKKSFDIIMNYIEEIHLPNRRKLNFDILNHLYKSRNLSWMRNNPFMIIHFKFSQYERYDNVQFILEKIEFIITKLYFIYALSYKSPENDMGSLFSTINTNNWQTLDINHFLTITTQKGQAEFNCLPVYFKNLWVFDTIHMNIELDYKMQSSKRWYYEAIKSLDDLYLGYLYYRLNNQNKKYLKYYRITNSIKYFRRSVKSLSVEDKIINLHTSYEILLIDNFEKKKKEQMLLRLWYIMRRKRQEKKKDINKYVADLIDERNNIIHGGESKNINIEYEYLYRLYCHFILNIMKDIKQIDSSCDKFLETYYNNIKKGR